MLCWVAGTTIWLTQSSLILLVLLCMYGSEVNVVEWVASVVFALVGLGKHLLNCLFFIYCLFFSENVEYKAIVTRVIKYFTIKWLNMLLNA